MKQVLLVSFLALSATTAAAQTLPAQISPEIEGLYKGPGKLSVYYLPTLEVSGICLGDERLIKDTLKHVPIPYVLSCSFLLPDGCSVFISYGQEPDELTKQIDICNKKTEIETLPP